MKRIEFLLFPILAVALMAGNAFAQSISLNSSRSNIYFSNANTPNAPDATVRIINDGDTETNLYAAIYVFDDSEELQECCSCVITPDGLLSESVNNNLTANPLTGIKPTRGVIKVVSSTSADPNIIAPQTGLRAWATHIQKAPSGFAVTETLFADSNLVSTRSED